ncbi:tetratricopeptide repeat protein [Thalassotalea euphylliae]|uniref:tetratricopeptide repeat protein n=1 Tax=Thalassotalea euphylliae TaxID=1655234 RepID=UPI00363EF9F7
MKMLLLLITVITLGFTSKVMATAKTEKIEQCNSDSCKQYFKQYKIAAKRGHPLAMLTLGQFYKNGYGVEANEKLALKYFKKAAKAGFTAAQLHAGYIYMTSDEHYDIDKSIKYLSRAAYYKDKNANFLLSILYFDKRYQRRDLKKVDQYLAMAYEQKHKQVPEAIAYIETEMPIDSATFPELTKAQEVVALVKNQQGVLEWPKDEMEVITITSPPLEDMFNEQLMAFRKPIKSTGTRFKGKTCTERQSCSIRMQIDDSFEFYLVFLSDIFEGSG